MNEQKVAPMIHSQPEPVAAVSSCSTGSRLLTDAQRKARAFTLLELIVVVAIVGILAAIAMPNMINTPRRAKEAVLKTNLRTLREVIDQHYGDKGAYPPTLDALVEEGYLRDVPYDPMTEKQEWGLVYDEGDPYSEPAETDIDGGGEPGIIDVYTLSTASSLDGEEYAEW